MTIYRAAFPTLARRGCKDRKNEEPITHEVLHLVIKRCLLYSAMSILFGQQLLF